MTSLAGQAVLVTGANRGMGCEYVTQLLARGASVLDSNSSKLREELKTNLFGPLAMASAFADRIAERSGVIVNVASVLAWLPAGASYGVSKAAMWNATESMRTELAPRGIQVVGVYMGPVDTDMAKFTDYPNAYSRG